MAFNGTEGGMIEITAAAALTAEHRKSMGGITQAHYFGRNNIDNILAQQGCVGVRVYRGIDVKGDHQLMIVGVDASGDDMLGMIADLSTPCPNSCSSANPLNGR